MGRYVNGEWVPDGQTSLSDHGAGDVFEAIPGGRHHIVDLFTEDVELTPVDPADQPWNVTTPSLPDWQYYRRGWYDE